MPRPLNKEQLLKAADENYEKLMSLISSVSVKEQEANFGFDDRDKNIRDVLAHLYEWHQMMKRWYADGMSGKKPAIPAQGYTWKTLPALNIEIWKQYQKTPLVKAKKELERSHKEIKALIISHTNGELFEKKKYNWTGTTSLGAYFVSSTSSHYDWAIKKIKRYVKELKA